mmetsp:Transcript_21362/g.41869  ORF Transcript_21362/g.41869 Transcript_21362/m.41869 type:complete len:449 (-) Transcript_21362:100-1446(-)|eukprot:CAMPEP_0171529182 /NCGR_PEP_ID=MMETSP0959-20130129/12197_1 /TAXON_ID=87120 /ORGANISM="Aurantiochytrium limacinum, Strain ATCCMYA-1381" /LENGTH=448 /DNA_ID=CAMNT_0012071469 /DNA_START=607 /DNA_END=1953 /DNA_ORIENTATION=+
MVVKRSSSSSATSSSTSCSSESKRPSKSRRRNQKSEVASESSERVLRSHSRSKNLQKSSDSCKSESKSSVVKVENCSETTMMKGTTSGIPRLLTDLGKLVSGKVIARPSKFVRTPYVADVMLLDGSEKIVQAHAPSLGCAGMVDKGRIVEMSEVPQKNDKSRKTTHTVSLCFDAPRLDGTSPRVGALPALAESFVQKSLEEGWFPEFEPGYSVTSQKTYGGSRVDFVLDYGSSGRKTLIEVKNAVCADYLPEEMPGGKSKGELEARLPSCLVNIDTGAPLRSAVFPHGGTQKPKIKVLSSRAIKHVHELTQIHASRTVEHENLDSAIIFLVNRNDCDRFRPAHESCPLFARVLYESILCGVRVLAYAVDWRDSKAYLAERLPVEFADETKDRPLNRVWLDQVLAYEAGPKLDSLGSSSKTKSGDKKSKKSKSSRKSRRREVEDPDYER